MVKGPPLVLNKGRFARATGRVVDLYHGHEKSSKLESYMLACLTARLGLLGPSAREVAGRRRGLGEGRLLIMRRM